MSKRERESKRGERQYAALQSLEDEIEKISLTLGGPKEQKPSASGRWGDMDEDTDTPPHGKTTVETFIDSVERPSGDDADSELQFSDVASRAESSTTAPDVKRLKMRDGPTPEFFGDFFDVLSPSSSDHLSFFKWARDEEPPPTTSPPKEKVKDEIDPGDAAAGATPVEKPKVGRSTPEVNIFRPVAKSRIQRDHSSDSSDMFLEQGSDAETEKAANQVDAGSIDLSLAKSQSFDPSLSKSRSFQPKMESDEEQGAKDGSSIVIPIATLVEDTNPEVLGLDGEKIPFYERRKFWVFVLCQFIIVAIVVVVVLVLRDSDGGDGQNSVGDGLDGTSTPAPSVMKGVTPFPSSSLGDTLAPAVPVQPTSFPTFLPEFTDIPAVFLDSYDSALTWFGVRGLGIGDPNLQRFVLGWMWYHTTNNGADPWISCNPPSLGESMQCEFLADNTSSDNEDLCYTSKTSVNRWLSSADECSWAGISCDLTGRVTAIMLPGAGLKGNFPFFIDRLTELKELDFSFGGLDGTLPEAIEALSKLQKLDLSHNLLVDPIPEPLFSLPLASLQLNANRFRGPIPSRFDSFSMISVLNLSENEFSGILPVEFSGLTKLEKLDLHSNNLVGSLPPMPWPLLLSLNVQGNGFEGSFPQEIL